MSTRLSGSSATINLEGLDLNWIDNENTEWGFHNISGWHQGATTIVNQDQRITSHGQFAQRGRRGGRVFAIDGWVHADIRLRAAVALQRIEATLADGGFGVFTFADDDLGERWASVQLLDLQLNWNESETFFRYQLQLLAPDPYKYGATSTDSTGFATAPLDTGMVFPLFPNGVMNFGPLAAATQVTVANAGTAEAQVTFTVTSPGADSGGFVITDVTTGKTITYSGIIPADGSLVLDGSDGSVTLNGTGDRLDDTLVQAWPTLLPGVTKSFLFERISGTGAPILTASVTSTFW